MNEQWKDIPGYEGVYQVSDQGRVKSMKRVVKHGYSGTIKLQERTLKLAYNYEEYAHVSLCKNGKRKIFGVHRLVLMAFDRMPHDKEECNHVDGNPSNNFLSNLEWVSAHENIHHRIHVLGTDISRPGESNGQSKLTDDDVLEIRKIYKAKQHSQKELGKMFGVSQANISDIIKGTIWKHI